MRLNFADFDAQAFFVDDQQASGVAASGTVAAVEDQFWAIDWIAWSYGGTPTSGNLLVTWGGTTMFSLDITTGGPGMIEFVRPLHTQNRQSGSLSPGPALNEAMVVTLADGSVANKLAFRYR